MGSAGNPLRKTTSCEHATLPICGWVAAFIVAACVATPSATAQDSENVPTIRVESRQVLIPTRVWVTVGNSDYQAVHLKTHDFRLFEDEKEQTIENVVLIRPYGTRLADSQGYRHSIALTPRAEWTNLGYRGMSASMVSLPIYEIAYRPPESPEGSCHNIKIKVNPKNESGNRMTTAEEPSVLAWNRLYTGAQVVDRRNLLLYYRTQYCNVTHSATDPLYGTPVNERLESAAKSDKVEMEGFYLSVADLFDESNTPHLRVALDFPHLSTQRGFPEFQVALLGMFNLTDSALAVRFSDSVKVGLSIEHYADFAPFYNWESFYNHYETEVDLPPGDYNLRVAIDFGGALRRAEVPVHVRAPDKSLAVSGIVLCRRYFAQNHPPPGPQIEPDGIPTLPFELTPLVSKGIEFTPTGDTRFKKKDALAAYFEVYEPLLAGGGNVHVQFEIRIVDAKTGEVKSDSGFRPADGYVNPGKMIIPISQKVAIEELTPGEYQVQVRAKDSSGNSTDWRTTSFTRE